MRPGRSTSSEEGRFIKVRPLHDRTLVKRIEEEDKTKGGIIIPDTAKEKPQQGRLLRTH